MKELRLLMLCRRDAGTEELLLLPEMFRPISDGCGEVSSAQRDSPMSGMCRITLELIMAKVTTAYLSDDPKAKMSSVEI